MKRPLNRKLTMQLTKVILTVFVLLVAYVIIAQTILIPQAISRQYSQQLNPGLKRLSAQFNAISKSTEADVYNDPYTDTTAGRKQLLSTQQLIAQTNQALDTYDQQAKKLPKSLFGFDTKSYKKAQVTRNVTQDVFLQSRSIMNQYQGLTNYLLAVNNARVVFKNNTSDINALTNLSQLAGQGDVIAKRAAQVNDMIATFEQAKFPAGYNDYNNTLLSSFKQGQAGLQQLSQGLYAANDAQINSGAAAIEKSVAAIESDGAQQFSKASSSSVALKDASSLSDKIDSLQPFAEQ